MDFILSNLSNNRVTLDIKANRFEEPYDYGEVGDADVEFARVDDLYDFYKKMLTGASARLSHAREPSPARPIGVAAPAPAPIGVAAPIDRFLHCVLLALDPTLELVPDATPFVDKFKSQLRDKAPNHATALKKHGFTVAEAIDSVSGKRDAAAAHRYISILTEKSILARDGDDWKLCENAGKPDCYAIDLSSSKVDVVAIAEAKRRLADARIAKLRDSIDMEKLNEMLVKDLKELAESIGCETTKIEAGKKKNLLKAELREVVKSKLYA